MFQCPFVPYMYLKAQDYIYLDRVYRSKESGFRNSQNFTDEDLEAFKWNLSRPGNFLILHSFFNSICLGAITAAISYNRAAIRNFRPPVLPNELIQPKTLIIFGEGILV